MAERAGAARRLRAAAPLLAGRACVTLGAALVPSGSLAEMVAPYSPTAVDASAHVPAGRAARHLFGTDRFGRDLLSRVLFGIRVSLGIAGAAIAIALAGRERARPAGRPRPRRGPGRWAG